MAYSAAEFSGTVARVGPDLVQHVLACAFMGVLKGGGMTKISEINADDRKVIELDRQAERRKHRFHLVPFEEIQLGTEPQYLVKGIIPRVGLTVIWGPPKCGKSFWIFDVTMHVALGWPYRGRRVQQCPVVYCAFEGQNGISARVEAFRQTFPINADQPVPFYLEPVTLDLIADQAELIATIKRHLAIDRPAWVIRCVAEHARHTKKDRQRGGLSEIRSGVLIRRLLEPSASCASRADLMRLGRRRRAGAWLGAGSPQR